MNPRRKTTAERRLKTKWRVIHEFTMGGSDVRKGRIIQRVGSRGLRGSFALEIAIPSRVDDTLAWMPYEKDVFQDTIAQLLHRDLVMELGRLASARLDDAELALRIAQQDDMLVSLVEGEDVEVQIAGSSSPWIPASFSCLENGWVRVFFEPDVMKEHHIDPHDPDEGLVARGHVRRREGS